MRIPGKRRSRKVGLSPGTMVHIGERRAEKVHIALLDYKEDHFEEKTVLVPSDAETYRDTKTVSWLNINGIHDVAMIEEIGRMYGLHPLTLEDIVNTEQRPKLEEFDDYLFIVVKFLSFDEKREALDSEQISIILGKNYVISFQERDSDMFQTVRERIRSGKGRMRTQGADYLAYALTDAIVDSYFLVLERFGDKIGDLEDDILENPSEKIIERLHHFKRVAIFLRKSVWPLREVLSFLDRQESKLISKATKIFLRDVYDHTIQVIDTIESLRDLLASMIEIYLSNISNRLNGVMKTLTIIATIFMPLTFITGLYGMNFEFMPELRWNGGYYVVLSIMALISGGMILAFKKKGWI